MIGWHRTLPRAGHPVPMSMRCPSCAVGWRGLLHSTCWCCGAEGVAGYVVTGCVPAR